MVAKNEHSKSAIIIACAALLIVNPAILFMIEVTLYLSIAAGFIAVVMAVWILIKFRKLLPLLFSFYTVFGLLIYGEAIFLMRFQEFIVEDLYNIKPDYYVNKPFLNKTLTDKEYQTTYKTNAQGFRIGREDDPYKKLTNVEWLFLGDSYTQGAQVEFGELYTTLLANNYGDRIVLNAGISGFGIAESLNYFRNEGLQLEPEVVFLQICNFNDFMKVHARTADFADILMNKSELLKHFLYPLKYSNPAELPLGRWTEPFYPDHQNNRDYNVFFKDKSERQLKDLANFSKYLQQFQELCLSRGVELVIVQLPTKEQLYFNELSEVVESFNIDPRDLDMNFPDRFLDSLSQKNGIKILNLRNDFESSKDRVYFAYDEHLNRLGHEILATSLERFVNTHIRSHRGVHRISSHNTGDRYPRVYGDTLLQQSIRDSNSEIIIKSLSDKVESRLTFDDVDQIHPDLKGNKLVYTQGNQDTGETEVIYRDLSTNELIVLTSGESFGAIPTFSEDGSKVVYAEWVNKGDFSTNPKIVLYDLSNGEKRALTDDLYEHWRPILSKNGKHVFYISKRDGQFDVYRKNIQNGNEVNLTNSDYDEWDIELSDNEENLVFASNEMGNWDLAVLNFKTNKVKYLTDSKGNEWDPYWANDSLFFAADYGIINGIYHIRVK